MRGRIYRTAGRAWWAHLPTGRIVRADSFAEAFALALEWAVADHRYREDCGCYGCRLEADCWDADPGFDAWAESFTDYLGPIPADQDDSAAVRVDVLRHARIRQPRLRMSDSTSRMGARKGVAHGW